MLSHTPRMAETRRVAAPHTLSDLSLPRVRRGQRDESDHNPAAALKRSSAISNSSSGRQSSGSGEYGSRQQQQPRPSALPRSTSSSSQARLSYIASTRPMPTYSGKTPAVQTLTLNGSNTGIPRLDTSRAFSSTASGTQYYLHSLAPMDTEADTVLGIVMPAKASTYPPSNLPPQLIPELQALAASSSGRFGNPASSSIGSISSPSTQFTTSSSPFSASTAATTPISWSSASPNVSQLAHSTSNKRSNTAPVPANVKTRVPKLPVVKETLPSASSSKVNLASDSERRSRRTKKSIDNVPDPVLPPRSSSLKRSRSRSDSATTGKSEKQPEPRLHIPEFPPPPTSSNMPRSERSMRREKPNISQGHSRLQDAINYGPRGDIGKSLPQAPENPLPAPAAHPQPRQLLEPAPIARTSHRRFPSLSRRHARGASSSETEVDKQSARSRLAKFSRLALFGRSKTITEKEVQPSAVQVRKGPAAGTGHEGYGKFGRRGRKQSISSSAGATDSETSVASLSRKPVEKRRSRISSNSRDQSDLDEFAAPRAKPVVIMGGSLRGRANPFPPMPKNPQLSDVSLSTMSSGDSYPAHTRFVSPRRERFLPDDEEARPTLAERRSQKSLKNEETFRFPEPIETQDLTATPCLDSVNTTQSSELPTPASAMYRIDPNMLDKQRSKSKKLKWNIFRRKDSISETAEGPVDRPRTRNGVVVNIAPAPAARQVPYYSLIGSENEIPNTMTINQFLQEAAESPEKEEEISIGFSDDEVYENPYIFRESMLLPSARHAPPPAPEPTPVPTPIPALPQVRPHVPQLVSPVREEEAESNEQMEQEQQAQTARRQPRLAQVGRIPKVVPTRQQSQNSVQAAQNPPTVSEAWKNLSVTAKTSREQLPRLRTRNISVQKAREPVINKPILEVPELPTAHYIRPASAEPEFLHFPERNSDFTTSSESTGIISIMGPPSIYIAPASKRQTSHYGHEDEVWKEYDDFMDDIMSPLSQQKSPQKVKVGKTTDRVPRITQPINSLREAAAPRGLAILPTPAHPAASSNHFLAAPEIGLSPSLHGMESSEEIRLRRSRIAAALHTSYAPSSPFSMRDFLDEYGRPVSKVSDRFSESSAPGMSPVQAVAPLRPQLLREQSAAREYESAAHLEEIERAHNPTRHSDRAYASLMVSRWLSFGRVLFSPAHNEIATNPERHVLVIDGLGSEDWSIYCAVTYQNERAYVHDLKERKAGKSQPRRPSASADTVPPNHRRAELNNFTDRFPFPPGFFSAIVVRFPPAMPDSKLKNIISECRRTLAPGGYLELMVLDIDIVNMGVQTRRAIKELKIKMTTADRNVSLKPIIDNVQTVLGSNGFSNLSKCIVGVPVVGKPAKSLDSSSESRSSAGSAYNVPGRGQRPGHVRTNSAGPRPYGSNDFSQKNTTNFSLNDLVADHSENADAKIGRVVSRTARSWWQHCFEASLIADGRGEKSVFSNKEVLNECKTRAANFKLLIAYTQKPIGTEVASKRRTVSESAIPTLATAGIGSSRNRI